MKSISQLLCELPAELAEEGTTGRDLIDSLIYQAKSESKLGYLGIDQYGTKYTIKKYPRKELMDMMGVKYANKMYVDLKSGGTAHQGYVIGDLWIDVYEVHKWNH